MVGFRPRPVKFAERKLKRTAALQNDVLLMMFEFAPSMVFSRDREAMEALSTLLRHRGCLGADWDSVKPMIVALERLKDRGLVKRIIKAVHQEQGNTIIDESTMRNNLGPGYDMEDLVVEFVSESVYDQEQEGVVPTPTLTDLYETIELDLYQLQYFLTPEGFEVSQAMQQHNDMKSAAGRGNRIAGLGLTIGAVLALASVVNAGVNLGWWGSDTSANSTSINRPVQVLGFPPRPFRLDLAPESVSNRSALSDPDS